MDTEVENMKEHEFSVTSTAARSESKLQALTGPNQGEILRGFTEEEQQAIQYRQRILSSIAYFIGKDFRIPVELNTPGEGWHWDFEKNKIRMDPKDLLEEPMEKLRFKTAHEGGHRRISRTADIPLEIWQQPGFSFLMNAIEDPRDNNFVVEGYPKFRRDMEFTYSEDLDFEKKVKGKAKQELGYTPRFIQAGFAYIRQWFDETQGKPSEVDEKLPDDVKAVVEATRDSARRSWLHYPSKQEADASEELIRQYAQASYVINRDHIWPEFKKLVDEDMQDQVMQEAIGDMQKDGKISEGKGEGGLSQQLKDQLSEAEQQELEEALENTMKGTQEGDTEDAQPGEGKIDSQGKPGIVDLDSLSDDLKQKIKDYIDSLPDDVKKELTRRAKQALEDYESEVNEDLEGRLTDNPEKKAAREASQDGKSDKVSDKSDEDVPSRIPPRSTEDLISYRDLVDKVLYKDENIYEQYRREALPLIDALETDLRAIFVQRRSQKWQTGFRSGKKIDIQRRMQEEAREVSPVESHAWQKRELPTEKDYAITLLVDLSGSMRGQKISETFKGAVVIAEVLNRLSINTEILGFNEGLYVYQGFGQDMDRDVREYMGGMLSEVQTPAARWNDDGWALEQTSERLAKQKVSEKFIFVLSDGQPVPSPQHSGEQYELGQIVRNIMSETDQKLIGLGIGSGTNHVTKYYPNSIADIGAAKMSEKLADVVREVIADYDAF